MRKLSFAAMLMVAAACLGQEASFSLGDQEFDLNAGLLEVNFDTGQISRIGEGADITIYPDQAGDPPIRIRAREIEFDYQAGATEPRSILFTGDVQVDHPSATVESGKALWDYGTNEIEFTQDPVLQNENVKNMRGSRMILGLNSMSLRVEQVQATFSSLSGMAAARERDTALLTTDDITDWTAFIAQVRQQAAAEAPNAGKHILELLDPTAKASLLNLPVEDLLANRQALIKQLNEALHSREFHKAAQYSGATLPQEAQALLGRGVDSLNPTDVTRLNRLVLEAVYPALVQPAG